MSKPISQLRYEAITQSGEKVRGYTLFDEDGHWIGFVTLEYNDLQRWGRLYSVTDYGNYGYLWDAIGNEGFLRFLLSNNDDYLTEKLAHGHGEAAVFQVRETWARIRKWFAEQNAAGDPDWLGGTLAALDTCQCEKDFYDWAEEYQIPDVYVLFVWEHGGYLDGYRDILLPELKRTIWRELRQGKKQRTKG